MITLQEFYQYLTQLLESTPVEDYCPNGIQVEGSKEIKTFATAVSASLPTIQSAVDLGVDALVVHHGMFWKFDTMSVEGVKREKLRLLIENNITLIGYHLPLDMHQEYGNNWKAAKDLGMKDLEPFGVYNGTAIGVQGAFDAISREAFIEKLEEYYGHNAATALGGKETVSTAAIVSGGAHGNISDAIKAEVDCFITGSFDEYIWNIAHEEKINFCALGHTATERVGPQALGKHLADTFDIKHSFIDTINPF
ncbi:MAG: Nif3-like dinuclear metal center hexameric protein [Waddliaceae bacterium]|jgi:dinuclear metal center YbgI/SA1388 family protein|nr:Nif3-like dinuclear metal center hexameric protein [Waddliaceae bacterium]MBT3578786.1 Nif3-like dinuclear metal center hexameric protein [Waddliaceae bacterium]MBT6928611.1 Nif3-like dinuclear metal center hexameric protein [Waddliaceae bacterium]MBT7265125.1 Nif3-like dinuclear metal center hexameric protein [Waddliaceae bacterium]MBT7461874.1 Nif3-like dinuclear metal center hexameric protein [Waddliaceae bacterium]